MKNCVGIAELLCAYADNELSESNRRLVEDHLVICENCSAILKMYKEISDSVNDTNVPAPEALCLGVMNRIQSEEPPHMIAISKKRRRYKYILTRYAPIAACLVVVLLVWQFWNPLRALLPGSSTASDNMLFAAPEAAMSDAAGSAMPTNEPGPVSDNEVIFDSDGVNAFTDDNLEPDPQAGGGQMMQTRNSEIDIASEPLILLIIDEDSLTPTGAAFVISNDWDGIIHYGDYFSIQVLNGGVWEDIVELRDDIGFNDILFIGEPGEANTFTVDWSLMYGHLPEGTYRLVKSITYANLDKPAFYIAGEFIIR